MNVAKLNGCLFSNCMSDAPLLAGMGYHSLQMSRSTTGRWGGEGWTAIGISFFYHCISPILWNKLHPSIWMALFYFSYAIEIDCSAKHDTCVISYLNITVIWLVLFMITINMGFFCFITLYVNLIKWPGLNHFAACNTEKK